MTPIAEAIKFAVAHEILLFSSMVSCKWTKERAAALSKDTNSKKMNQAEMSTNMLVATRKALINEMSKAAMISLILPNFLAKKK